MRASEYLKQKIHLKMMVYGMPGVGKSYFALQAALAGKVMYCDIDRNLSVLARHPLLKKLEGNLDIREVNSSKDLEARINEAIEHDYSCIVIDTISSYNKLLMQEVLEPQKKEVPLLNDWQVIIARMRALIQSLKKVNIHIIALCHAKQDKDDNTGVISYLPALNGDLPFELNAYFNVIGFYEVRMIKSEEDAVRKIWVSPTNRYLAKNTIGGLDSWEAPDLMNIVSKLFSIFKEEKKNAKV